MIPLEQSWGQEHPHVAAIQLIAGDEAGQAMPKRVDKTWGYELHYKNDNQYCMKLLHFNGPGEKAYDMQDPAVSTSMHFHVMKHETLLVTKGILTLELIINKKIVIQKLEPGQAWVVCPGHIHRLSAVEGPVDLVEASTYDQANDSVRVN
jgi:D-lyxose ketol-isomerase